MNNTKFQSASLLILILTLFISLSGCRKKGPLGLELDRAQREFHRLEQIRDPEERKTTAHRLMESTGHLLSEQYYRDPADLREKKKIMYRASILMTAMAEKIEARSIALQFYMNAYLLQPSSALKDAKRMVPTDGDWKDYEAIRIPRYRIDSEKRTPLPDNNAIAVPGGISSASDGTTPFRLSLTIHTDSILSILMLQMVAGDILFRRREKEPGLASMVIVYYVSPATPPDSTMAPARGYASAFWDAESDHITIELNGTR